MKMKIKIKNLIFLIIGLIFCLVWLLPTSFLLIGGAFENKSPEKAAFFYEKYASHPTTFSIKGDYLQAKSLIGSSSKFIKYFNAWGGGENKSPENMEKAKLVLEDLMEERPGKSQERYYIDSYKLLLDLAIARGDSQLLRKWISFGHDSDYEEIIYLSDLYSAFLFHVNGNRSQAEKILEGYEDSDLNDVNLEILKAEIALFQGNYEESEKLYEDIQNHNWPSLHLGNFGSQGYYGRYNWFDWELEDLKGDNIIRGRVSYEGQPLPFVEIYAQALTGGTAFRAGGESYIAISDENGNFESLGLKDGVYNIGVGIDDSLLTDKVLYSSANDYIELDGGDGAIDFEFKDTLNITEPKGVETITGQEFTVAWEEVEGADYYTVEIISFSDIYGKDIGAVFWAPAYDENGDIKHRGNSAIFNIEAQQNAIGGHGLGEEGLISPNAILGLFLPDAEYPLLVNAYDENDRLISSSLPLRTYYDKIPSVKVLGSLSEGEELILNQEYPQAIDYYENILKEDPNNIDALRYLTKIYGIGWKDGEKNIQRAIDLGTSFANLTENKKLLYNIIGYMDIDEIKQYQDLFESIVLEEEDFSNPIHHYHLSRYYMAMEDWENARYALEKEEGHTSDELIYLNIYFGDYKEAAEAAKYSYNSSLTSERFGSALRSLEKNPPNSKEKQILDSFLLELISGLGREEGKAIYNEIVDEISNSNIRMILKEIYLSRSWDIEDDY